MKRNSYQLSFKVKYYFRGHSLMLFVVLFALFRLLIRSLFVCCSNSVVVELNLNTRGQTLGFAM